VATVRLGRRAANARSVFVLWLVRSGSRAVDAVYRLHAFWLLELALPSEPQRQGGRHGANTHTPLAQSSGQPIPSRPYIRGLADEGDDMHHELMAFEAIHGHQTRGYPIDLELRRAHRAQRSRRRLFAALRALVVHLSRTGEKR
jgi:triphosphoribosyl-dephospho-CoA synthetase